MCRRRDPPPARGKRLDKQAQRRADKPPHGGCHRLDHRDEQPPDRVVIGKKAAKCADQRKAAHPPVPRDKKEHAHQHCGDGEKQKIAERGKKEPEKIAPAAGRAHVDEKQHTRKAHCVIEHAEQHAEQNGGGKARRLCLHRNFHYFARRANSPFFSPGMAA